jgi:protein-disulfide isomerase
MPMVRDYVSMGKVYLIHRYFPLPVHAYSRVAANYACAAQRIGKYEQVANALFANQVVWSANGNVDETACRVLTADESKKVRALIKDPGVAAEIEQDLVLGQKAIVRQTPTMVVTHRLKQYPLSGFQNYDLLRRFLDELLAK